MASLSSCIVLEGDVDSEADSMDSKSISNRPLIGECIGENADAELTSVSRFDVIVSGPEINVPRALLRRLSRTRGKCRLMSGRSGGMDVQNIARSHCSH